MKQGSLVSILKQYLRTDILPEYIDINLVRHSALNARENLSNLESLILSIKQNGLLQPIIVRPSGSKFEVVAGNRRLEACKRLHWVRIPCLVKDLSDKETYEIGLIENIERETLTPIETARAFQRYVKEKGWGGVKALARTIGRSEEYVSHKIALLSLPPLVLDLINSDKISPSAAHELIWMKDAEDQKTLGRAIVQKKLSAKKVREMVILSKNGVEIDDLVTDNKLVVEEGLSSTKSPERAVAEKRMRLLDNSILTLRICVLRLDSLIEELDDQSKSDSLREILIKKRFYVHNQIDELIRFKKSIVIL
jgi:ParB family chromosome partitioning protein